MDIDELLNRYFEGETSSEEERDFEPSLLPGMFRTGWRSIRLCLPIWRKRVGRNDSRMRH